MKVLAIFLSMMLAFSTANACGKCKLKPHLDKHRAGKSHSKPRSKDTTSKEIRKKPQKPQRGHEKKRDRYGSFIIPLKERKPVLDEINMSENIA